MKLTLLFFAGLTAHVAALTYKSADISSLLVEEAAGKSYKDLNGNTAKLETILAGQGMNLARIRVWTAGDYIYQNALTIAKRAQAVGMKIYLDMHYSDTWADPGHQAIPGGWPTTLSGLDTQIFTYTTTVLQAFISAGVPVEIISLGNEITNGLLLPVGNLSSSAGFSAASEILHSAASAVRQTSPSTKTMIHLSDGWSSGEQDFFYGSIFLPGKLALADVDIMGHSLYPFYGTSATFANLQSTQNGLIAKYGKNVMNVETNWPVTCSGTALSQPSIPISIAGQQTWITDLKNTLTALSGSHGIGISYWEPAWLNNAGLGSSCADNLLFDSTGKARASVNIFSLM
jgi:arabinogalactan endo-1,4-beta-galactosidase